MKKKLALLLALTMVLSMLPMNVFGVIFGLNPDAIYDRSILINTVGSAYKDGVQHDNDFRYVYDLTIAVDLNYHNQYQPEGSRDNKNGYNPILLPSESYNGTGEYYTTSYLRIPVKVEDGQFADSIGSQWLPWSDAGLTNPWLRELSSYSHVSYDSDGNPVPYREATLLDPNLLPISTTGPAVIWEPPVVNYALRVLSANTAELLIFDNWDTIDLYNTTKLADDLLRYAQIGGIYVFSPSGDTVPKVILGDASQGANDVIIPNAMPAANRTLTVSVANPTAGETFLYFDELRIAERIRGDFTNGAMGFGTTALVTLFAPNNFQWVTPNNNQFIQNMPHFTNQTVNYQFGYNTRWSDTYVALRINSGSGDVGARYLRSADGRYLTIVLQLGINEGVGMTTFAERIGLRGIGLVADHRANFESVSVDYIVDYVSGIGTGNTTMADLLASTLVHTGGISWSERGDINVGDNWILPIRWNANGWQSFSAGTRTWNEAEYGLRDGAEPTEGRSGDQGYWSYGEGAGAWTQWVRLQENAVGAWGAGLGMDITFSVPDHGGAVIIGASVAIPDTNWPYTHNNGQYYNLSDGDGEPDRNTRGVWNYADARGVLVTPNYVRITPALQNWAERAGLRNIDIRFQLSLEPGYEDKHGPDVDITVTGPSVANLLGSNVVTAMTVMDPITVDVDMTPLTVTDSSTYNVAVRDIGEIVIRETEYGRLRKGDDIWVYVIGARANEVEFTADIVATVNTAESGLVLTRGSTLRHRWSNSWINGIRFTVEERSHERASRDNNELGEIIITGGKITGPVYPGAEYEVVVSGNNVANSNYTVFENRQFTSIGTVDSFIDSRSRSWRLFDSEPYQEAAFEYDVETSAPPPAEVEAPPAIVSQSLTLNAFSPEINGVKPFVMVQVSGDTSVGMVSPRVIAEFFGGTANWDANTGTATINGTHVDGSAVEVTLQAGATTGTINGQSFDIATYSGSAAPGLVSVYTSESNNFYVPMRFMTNAFGYTIDWNPMTATATIRH